MMSTDDEFEMTPQIAKDVFPAQYIEFDQTGEQIQNRKQFLIKFHITQILQFGIVLIMIWFGDIFLQNIEHEKPDYETTYNEFRENFGFDQSFRDYLKWRQDQTWIQKTLKWQFYFVLAALIILTITILVERNLLQIIRFQKALFIAQSALGGLVLAGLLSIHSETEKYYLGLLLFLLIAMIINGSLIIVLIKKDKLILYEDIKYIAMILLLILLILDNSWSLKYIPIIEIVTFYYFYYYDQLNNSLLKDQNEIKDHREFLQLLLSKLKSFRKVQTDQEKAENSGNNQLIPKKLLAFYIVVLVLFILFSMFSITLQYPIFILFATVCFVNLMGLIFNVSVASKTLRFDHEYIAVCITPIDFLNPLKYYEKSLNT